MTGAGGGEAGGAPRADRDALLAVLLAFSMPMPFWFAELGFPVTDPAARDLWLYGFVFSANWAYHAWMHAVFALGLAAAYRLAAR